MAEFLNNFYPFAQRRTPGSRFRTGLGGTVPIDNEKEVGIAMPVGRDAEKYNMDHPRRGLGVIFNHENFDPRLELGTRHGTERDRINLEITLASKGFDVVVHKDLTYQKIAMEIDKLQNTDHSQHDCILICVLSHGDANLMYAADHSYKPDLIWYSFTPDKCPSLAGKPKLFFIQACQGSGLDSGTRLVKVSLNHEVDSSPQSYTIPNHSDFLIMYSTVPGFYSWRNTTNGSWFIQGLCNVFKEHGDRMDLLSMMTRVIREVALFFESNVPNTPHMHEKKQSPYLTTTLMRDVFFTPKNGNGTTNGIVNGMPMHH